MAQGTLLGRPTISALMKLAMRPKKMPIGTAANAAHCQPTKLGSRLIAAPHGGAGNR